MKHDEEEDKKLIAAYQSGHQEALEQVMLKYYDYIFNLLRYKGLPVTEAENYAHDLCARLIQSLQTFRFESSFKTFVDRAINNQAITFYRTRSRNRFVSLFSLAFSNPEDETRYVDVAENANAEPPDQDVLHRELLQVMGTCIRLITNHTMRILVCLWLKNVKRREMAELLKISPGTVNGTLERGKEKFRACIKDKYFGER